MASFRSPRLAAARIVAIYAFFASVWILASDSAVESFTKDPRLMTTLSVIKGWLFVLLTSLLLYQLIYRDNRQRNTLTVQLQAVLDAASEFSIIATDVDGYVTLFSRGAERMFGYSADEMIGHKNTLALHLAEEVNERSMQLCRELNRPVSGFDVFIEHARLHGKDAQDWTFVHKDGSRFPARLVVTPLHDQAGNLYGYLGVGINISEQRAIEDRLRERVAVGISELRQKDELLQSQSRLAAMGEMLTNIAHQWRQPLNNIALLLQTLQFSHERNEMTSDELQQTVTNTLAICRYMSNTINDFRNFFRQEHEVSEFCVNEAVERAVALIKVSLDTHSIKVTIETDRQVTTSGFPNGYAQALLNIINNARDALLELKPETPQIRIGIRAVADKAHVTIRDNAGGIPAAILPNIFDPYFTTKDKSQGTGIGLYMAKTIVEKNMKGSLTVANVEDGAEFRIETALIP